MHCIKKITFPSTGNIFFLIAITFVQVSNPKVCVSKVGTMRGKKSTQAQ